MRDEGVKVLGPGDPCPCCGMPIKTEDPEKLWLLTCFALKLKARGLYPPKGGGGKEAEP